MQQVLILKVGDTIPTFAATHGDFEDWIVAPLSEYRGIITVWDPRSTTLLPDFSSISAMIITGSHSMVTDRPEWSERIAEWLPAVVDRGIPLLGICYGHQLLAHAMGGIVSDNPRGREFGTCTIGFTPEAANDPLLGYFAPAMAVNLCHTQSVIRLPTGAVRLAESDKDPNQAFRIGNCAWGVQFHPEFDRMAMCAYIRECAGLLSGEGQVPEELDRAAADTPEGGMLLQRFLKLALGK